MASRGQRATPHRALKRRVKPAEFGRSRNGLGNHVRSQGHIQNLNGGLRSLIVGWVKVAPVA